MKSLSTMLVEEVHSLSYATDTYRVILRSVTDEEIEPGFALPPAAVKVELVCTGERGKAYLARLGEYVTMELRKRHA